MGANPGGNCAHAQACTCSGLLARDNLAPGKKGYFSTEGEGALRGSTHIWEHQQELAQGACALPKVPGDRPTPG